MDTIKLINTSKYFTGHEILQNLNISIEEGEFVAFLGPSGCGKSTLLSLIAGLIQPSKGKVVNTFHKQRISFVFQEASLMPWQTIEKNIALPLELMNKEKNEIKKEVFSKLKMFRLEEFKKYYPWQMSGGMKMRTSIARALISNPTLLLMDEPFSALDELLREKCADEVLNIWKEQNITSILVTHSIPEAVYLCHKIYILSPRPGTIAEVIELDKNIQKEKNSAFRDSQLFHSTCKKIRSIMETFRYE